MDIVDMKGGWTDDINMDGKFIKKNNMGEIHINIYIFMGKKTNI